MEYELRNIGELNYSITMDKISAFLELHGMYIKYRTGYGIKVKVTDDKLFFLFKIKYNHLFFNKDTI